MKCRYFFAKPEVRGSGHPQGARPQGAGDQLEAAQNCDHSIVVGQIDATAPIDLRKAE
jgi:hypothetical protein